MRRLTEVRAEPGPAGVAAAREALAAALAGGPAVAPVPAGDDAYAARIRAALRPDDDTTPLERDDVVAVVATSGSTGEPRGVLLTEGALRAATAALETRLGGTGDWVAALPVHAVGGFMVVVRALLAGTDLHIDPAVGGAASFDPHVLASTVRVAVASASRPVCVSLVPTQLQRLADADELDALDGVAAVLSGAAVTPLPLQERLRDAGIMLLVSYGMSETCGGCAYDGLPQPGLEFRTDAPDGEAAGRLSITGAAVAAGYRLRPDDASLRDGTVVTNDLAVLENGRVRVLGRVDEVVVVGGTNVALPAVTEVLRAQPGVRDAHVIAEPDADLGARLVAFVVDDAAAQPTDDASLRAAVRAPLGRAAEPRQVVRVAEIPQLPTGKPDRVALAAHLRA